VGETTVPGPSSEERTHKCLPSDCDKQSIISVDFFEVISHLSIPHGSGGECRRYLRCVDVQCFEISVGIR
jgi:hypothetical protein